MRVPIQVLHEKGWAGRINLDYSVKPPLSFDTRIKPCYSGRTEVHQIGDAAYWPFVLSRPKAVSKHDRPTEECRFIPYSYRINKCLLGGSGLLAASVNSTCNLPHSGLPDFVIKPDETTRGPAGVGAVYADTVGKILTALSQYSKGRSTQNCRLHHSP